MKKMKKMKNWVLCVLFLLCTIAVFADPPPPDPSGNPISGGGIPVGGVGAPINDGIFILLLLSATYGIYKFYKEIKKKNPDFMKKNFYLILFMMMLCNVGFSQTTYTWNGNGGSDWQMGSNWYPVHRLVID